MPRIFFVAVFVAAIALAQDAPPAALTAPDVAAPALTTPPPVTGPFDLLPTSQPLTLGQKYMYTLDRTIGPTAWVGFAARAGIDKLWYTPKKWGDGSESYGIAAAAHFGNRLVRENLAFGVRAIDHEDPRYFRLGHGRVWQRTRYAILHTFLVHNDNGSLMPAYSLLISSYATPLIARPWDPRVFTPAREMHLGTTGVAVGIAQSLWLEFSPDLRKHLPRRFRGY